MALIGIVEGAHLLAQMEGHVKKRFTLDAIKRILLLISISRLSLSSRTYTGSTSRPRNYSIFSRGFFSPVVPNHPTAAGIAKSGTQATRKRVCIASKIPEDGTINSKATANG